MSQRSIYLGIYRGNPSQRANLAISVPNAPSDRPQLSDNFTVAPCKGTIVHVVGEPVMVGFALQFKRNYDCTTSRDLKHLIFLGSVDSANIFHPLDPVNGPFLSEPTPRARIEQEATRVPPPPRGQNVRALVDGIDRKDCQDWVLEYLARLVGRGLIDRSALEIARSHRDPPHHGVFGLRTTGPAAAPQGQTTQAEFVWDEDSTRYKYFDGRQWRWM